MIYIGLSTVLDEIIKPTNQFTFVLFATFSHTTLLSVLGAHVLLNLKIEGEKGTHQGSSFKSTLTGINFVEPSLRSAEDLEEDEEEMPVDINEIEEISV